jgi:sulfate adenylyltransferase
MSLTHVAPLTPRRPPCRLPNGLLFGIPVVLDTNRVDLTPGTKVCLTQAGNPVATMEIESRWTPDKPKEALKCYGTSALEHPGARMIAMERKHEYIGGSLTGLARPDRVFFCETPAEVRASLPADKDIVAFQCRNPVHRAHFELFMRALDADNVAADSIVMVHPTCGPTQEDDISGEVRYQTYLVLKDQLNNDRVKWAYLPYSMHMAGPREAIQHMMIRKNYGCTHFIIGRDMAGSKSSVTGEDFYGAYDAQQFANEHSAELGIKTVESLNLVCTESGEYITAEEAKEKDLKVMKLSGTEFRRRLRAGEEIPEWFAFKSVVDVLRAAQDA